MRNTENKMRFTTTYKMNHKYYLKSNKEQRKIQFIIGIVTLFLNLIVLLISMRINVYFLIFLSVIITLSIIAPFFDVPSLKKKGNLIYYSSLFIAEKEKNEKIIIHGGSLFDYFFVIDRKLNGKQRTNFILQKYLEGILNLIDVYENNTSLKIKGTTYVLNERTAKKIGLNIVRTDFLQKFILTFNYMNLLVSNSIAKNKIAFPKLNNIITFESSIIELTTRKEFIRELNSKIKNTIASNG